MIYGRIYNVGLYNKQWLIEYQSTGYLTIILNKNKKPFSKYITLTNRIIDYPPDYFPNPIVTQVYYKNYFPKSIYNIYALIIYDSESYFR